MRDEFATAMGRALEATRAGDPAHATRIIQAALNGQDLSATAATQATDAPASEAPAEGRIERFPGRRRTERRADVEDAEIVAPSGGAKRASRRRRLPDVIEALRRGMPAVAPGGRGGGAAPEIPPGARWETRSAATPHGARDFRLYVPADLTAPRGLVMMLHGCTQTPEDFARGTAMNAEADRHGLIVVYPQQTRTDNAQGCWNWFRPGDQARAGEPAILARMAQDVAAEFGIGPDTTFVAGLSAGGAMAAILAAGHPDVFAAAGVHSGLPAGAAHDVVSAFAAMRGEAGGTVANGPPVRTIVFHGTADRTVAASNARRLVSAAIAGQAAKIDRETGDAAGGRSWRRETARGADGRVLAEMWLVDGAGHAWFGGDPSGSYADAAGPVASAEMVRFFLSPD